MSLSTFVADSVRREIFPEPQRQEKTAEDEPHTPPAPQMLEASFGSVTLCHAAGLGRFAKLTSQTNALYTFCRGIYPDSQSRALDPL